MHARIPVGTVNSRGAGAGGFPGSLITTHTADTAPPHYYYIHSPDVGPHGRPRPAASFAAVLLLSDGSIPQLHAVMEL